ncbi:MAG: hypothetical protein HKN15_02195, partial [Xanthomonadales bacterium]|nr:hypothetical protein [Xanthomonadales bacterium]
METENSANEDRWPQLRQLLEDSRFKWRTVNGLARDSGLSVADVLDLLRQHQAEIVKSAIPSERGEALYT